MKMLRYCSSLEETWTYYKWCQSIERGNTFGFIPWWVEIPHLNTSNRYPYGIKNPFLINTKKKCLEERWMFWISKLSDSKQQSLFLCFWFCNSGGAPGGTQHVTLVMFHVTFTVAGISKVISSLTSGNSVRMVKEQGVSLSLPLYLSPLMATSAC